MADDSNPSIGLTDSEARLYGRCGLSAQDALAWKSRGIGPYWAEGFLRLGLSLEESALVSDAGFGPAAVGADPDSDHFEESWAVIGLDDESARAIGAAFGQVAVFRLANGVQTVLACSADWTRSRSL